MALLRKELRALAPQAVLLALFTSGDVLYRPFAERIDELEWVRVAADIEPGKGGGAAMMLMIFAFVLAYSSLAREHDEGTIEFLYSLPVTRRRVFGVKLLACAMVLLGVHAFGHVTNALLIPWNPQTYSGAQFRASIALSTYLAQSVFALCMLCHGMLASFMRRFGLLPYAVLGWLVMTLEKASPRLAWMNPFGLCEFSYVGERVVLPWAEMAAQSAIALGALALAYALWTTSAERVTGFFARVKTGGGASARVAIPMGCATVLVVFAVLGVLVATSLRSRDDATDTLRDHGVSYQTARARTAHFTFTYPVNLRARALAVMNHAEALYTGVRARLGDTGAAPDVVVDLTEESAEHEGITAWTKVRMTLSGDGSTETHLRHVFAHETTHAVEFRLTDRRMGDHRDDTLMFVEGLAEWVGFEVEPDPEARRLSRIVGAVSFARDRLTVEEALDLSRLRARTDSNLVYPLGETFAQAVVDACGPSAPGELLRAMARPDAAGALHGTAWWQEQLQTIHCDLERVIGAWDAVRADVLTREAAVVETLPRMTFASVQVTGERVRVTATLDRASPPGATYVMRARRDVSTADTDIVGAEGELADDGRTVRYALPRSVLYGRRFELSLGVMLRPGLWPLCEPWQPALAP